MKIIFFKIIHWFYRGLCQAITWIDGMKEKITPAPSLTLPTMGEGRKNELPTAVIPMKMGIQKKQSWIPACAGMTRIFAGMTKILPLLQAAFTRTALVFAGMTRPSLSELRRAGKAISGWLKNVALRLASLAHRINNYYLSLSKASLNVALRLRSGCKKYYRLLKIIGWTIVTVLILYGLVTHPLMTLLALNLVLLSVINILLYISWKKDKCVPYVSDWLRKRYVASIEIKKKLEKIYEDRHQLKIKFLEIGESAIYIQLWPFLKLFAATIHYSVYKLYSKILYHLALISSSSQDSLGLSFVVPRFNRGIQGVILAKAGIQNRETVDSRLRGNDKNICGNDKWGEESFLHYQQKQKRVSVFSLSGLIVMIIATSFSSLILNFAFPNIFNTNAATYNMVQTSWAGGASVTATSTHTSNQTGWTQYNAASSSIDFGTAGQITLTTSTNYVTSTDDGSTYTGFNLSGASFASTEVSGSGSNASVNLSGSVVYGTTETFITAISGTWTVPAGVTSTKIEAWGGGGGGGCETACGSGFAAGGGAGGGAYARKNEYTVTSGGQIGYVVGAGGSGAVGATTDGSNTTFNTNTVIAAGGTKASGKVGGAGGTTENSTGDVTYAGGSGATSNVSNGGGGGGSGGSASDGNSVTINTNTGATAVTGGGPGGSGSTSVGTPGSPPASGPGGGGGGARYQGGAGVAGGNGYTGQLKLTYNSITYSNSGTYTSGAINISSSTALTTLTFSTTTQSSTDVYLKARSADNSSMTGATDWSSCSFLNSGSNLSIGNCVTNSHQYIQYQALLSSSSTSVTPSLNSTTIGYTSYVSTSTLISNPFDSEQSTNIVGNLTWSETLPSGTDVKFQIRTSADGATWTDWLGPIGAGSYYSTSTASTINSTHADGANDRYVQYQVWLTSDGVNTPTLSDVTLTYVINDAPNYDPNTSVTASQQTSDGYVAISYSVRDTDTAASGVGCPLCVTPSFEYSTDNGDNYTTITSGLSTSATTTKTVGTSSYTAYSLTWNPVVLDGTYVSQAKIRITVNDGEGGNATAVTSTLAFALDVKDPAVGASPIIVRATSTPAGIVLSATDNSSFQMCLTLDGSTSNCATYTSATSTYLATDPDTAYVVFKDAYQNTTAAYSATTPETPSLLLAKDVSNIAVGEYREFIAWRKVTGSFSNYKLLISTDGSTYSVTTTISDVNTNYYLNTGLTASTTYYYKVATEDSGTNTSYLSSALSDTVNGQGGTDTTPPTISAVSMSTSSPQSAVIVWDTDELASSYVDYSTTAGSFSTTQGSVTMRDTSSNAGQHSVGLTDLTANTTYYYRVRSIDSSSNSNSDSNGGNGYSFTTPSGPILTGVSAISVNNTKATIIWNTDSASNSYVVYSTSSAQSYTLETGSGSDSTTAHSVSLTGLSASTTYYYYVKSGIGRNDNGGSYYTFITSNDTTAPTISSISASLVIDTKSAVEWTTNEAADSKVQIGTSSGSYNTASSSNSALGTAHTLILTGLSANTAYYYIVVSGDNNGNYTTSSEQTLNTLQTLSTESQVTARETAAAAAISCQPVNICPAVDTTPPTISNIRVGVSNQNAGIRWNTDESADSFIKYGLRNDNLDRIEGDFKLVLNHNTGLNNLSPATKYYFTINSADAAGNRAVSPVKDFTTLQAGEAGKSIILPDGTTESKKEEEKPPPPPPNLAQQTVQDALLNTIKDLQGQFSVEALEEKSQDLLKTFAEFVPAPILSGEPKVAVTAREATIFWRTNKPASSMVASAPDKDFKASKGDEAYLQVTGKPDDAVTTHSVILYNLEPDTLYHYQVRSIDSLNHAAKSGDFTFKTEQESLEISDYVVQVVGASQAIFKWITTMPTNSEVKYMPYRNGVLAVEEKKIETDKVMTTLHEITLDELEAGVIYQVELSGRDLTGQAVSRIISSFSTSKDDLPPIIYQVQTESALSPGSDSKVQTIISWLTNEPATGQVFYQKGAGVIDEKAWVKTTLDPNYTKKHVVVITKFDPGAIYKFKIFSTDSGNNLSESRVYTILSPRQKESVFQIIVNNFEKTFGWTKRLGL